MVNPGLHPPERKQHHLIIDLPYRKEIIIPIIITMEPENG
jgi:hypothetical protein